MERGRPGTEGGMEQFDVRETKPKLCPRCTLYCIVILTMLCFYSAITMKNMKYT